MTKPPNYVTIAQARLDPKGTSLIVKVVSIGELKKGDDWKRQSVVVKDNSDSQEIMTWNKEIGLLEIGHCYKLDKPYWKDYEGDLQLSLGKYCTIMECQESDLLPVTAGAYEPRPEVKEAQTPEPTKPTQVNPDLLKTAQEIIGIAKLPGVNLRLNTIWAIEMIVRDYLMETEKKTPDSARVGMYVKLVLDDVKKV